MLKSGLNWKQSPLCKLLGITIPLIQAPMAGGATTPTLVANVCESGGLGSIGAGYLSPEALSQIIDEVRSLTDKTFAVNLFIPESHQADPQQQLMMQQKLNTVCAELACDIPEITKPFCPDFTAQMQVVIDKKVPVFSFTFGIPDQVWFKKLRQNKTKILGTATSLAEAMVLQNAGVDAIVAQSTEAGGHRGTFIGTAEDSLLGSFALIPQLAKKVAVPLIAAGGIMNGSTVLAALLLGAKGVQLGTAFLSCPESGISDIYKHVLLTQEQDTTRLTRAFSGKLARGINNHFIESMLDVDCLDYPIQNVLTKTLRQAAIQQNNPEFMSLFAGQAAHLSRGLPATELIAVLEQELFKQLKA